MALSQLIKYPKYFLLQWKKVEGTYKYNIYKKIDSNWVNKGYFYATGKEYYKYTVGPHIDGDIPEWKVTALDIYGNESIGLEYTTEISCNPDSPMVEMNYNETTGNITITAVV